MIIKECRSRYVPYERYPHRDYPQYSTGPAYVMTSAAIAAVLNGTSSVNGFHVEDALYTGVIAENVGVSKFPRPWLFHPEEAVGWSDSSRKVSPVQDCSKQWGGLTKRSGGSSSVGRIVQDWFRRLQACFVSKNISQRKAKLLENPRKE